MPSHGCAPPKKNIESLITSAVPEQIGIGKFGIFCAEVIGINTANKKAIILIVFFIIELSNTFMLILQLVEINANKETKNSIDA